MLDISHNAFTSLPSLAGKIKGTLKVTHNALTFEDILPNLEIKNFTYEPQREIGEEKNIVASEGDTIVIDLNIDKKVNSNQYTWFKDGKEIEKSNNNQFVIKAVKLADAGVYTCAIVNTKAKELTIYSKPVTLTVDNRLQFITLTDIPDKTYGDPPFEISATASSGLPVKYILVAGPATLAGKTITLTGVGTITIRVEQGGNENYKTAEPVERSFLVEKASQMLTFADPENKVFGDPPFELSATSSSGLPVGFTIVSGPASLSGKVLNIEGAGRVTVQALQPGNANHKAAEPVERSFQIDKALQTINFTKPEDKTYLDPSFLLEATSSS
jgi:hypothetical protein